MANEAHKEPTMEEILSSIRKIISDDSGDGGEAPDSAASLKVEDVVVEEADNDAFEDLTFDDVEAESSEDVFEASLDDSMFEPTITEESDFGGIDIDDLPEPASFDEMLDSAAKPKEEPAPEPAEASTDDAASFEALAPVTPPTPANEEEDMAASAKYQETVLTDDNTADAAAGALGKLITSMELGGDNTIEGLVREMLKPMIKDWLDTNLPGIVEEKVEAEVQRIARMAR